MHITISRDGATHLSDRIHIFDNDDREIVIRRTQLKTLTKNLRFIERHPDGTPS